jgi:predicted regulator of Ras-like GTPase activity (Roadblock/LC7/MglB family)
MAIKGRLSEMSLPTLVQLACQEAARAQLNVNQGDAQAKLYFADGNLVHATLLGEAGTEDGEEVVYRILSWEDGEFSLESGVVSPAQTIHTPWSALLMDGLQRRDEERWDTLEIEEIEEGYEMAENLRDILAEMGGQVQGFVAASVTGMDGLGIADHTTPGVNVESINAQLTLLVKLVDTTVAKLGSGEMDHGLMTTERSYMLWRHFGDDDYYLALAANRSDANLGNLLLMSRIYGERLAKAMPR